MRESVRSYNHQNLDGSFREVTEKTIYLSHPEDFVEQDGNADLVVSQDGMHFELPLLLQRDINALQEAQRNNKSLEHGSVRIKKNDRIYIPQLHVVSCSETSCRIEVFAHDGDGVSSRSPAPTTVDQFHTHTEVMGGDPRIGNIFSAGDILSMGWKRSWRSWMIGVDGKARVLINPYKREYRDEYDLAAYKYGGKFRPGVTYSEMFGDFLECVAECDLLYYEARHAEGDEFDLINPEILRTTSDIKLIDALKTRFRV